MDCYTENVITEIDRNIKWGYEHDWFDKQKYLDAIIAHAEKRRTTDPRGSEKTRHGSGRKKAKNG